MPLIVQDSDDSDAEDLPVDHVSTTTLPAIDHNLISTLRTASASPSSQATVVDIGNALETAALPFHVTPLGTRSTDSSSDKAMRKQLEKAHSALFEATPAVEKAEVEGSHGKKRLKRTKTVAGNGDVGDVSREGEKVKRRKTTQTYGGKGSKGGFGEMWDVPSSAGDKQEGGLGFLTHNPNELFPVSTGSMESRGPKTQVLDAGSLRESQHSQRSITSQNVTKVQTVESMIVSNIQTIECDRALHQEMPDIEETRIASDCFKAQEVVVQITRAQSRDVEEDQSVQEMRRKSKVNKYKIADEDDSDEERINAVNASISCTKSAGSRDDTEVVPTEKNGIPQTMNLSTISNNMETNEPTRKRKNHNMDPINEENDDELSLETPKEMYKPRPSKSRGALASVEVKSVDITGPPKLTKSKLRRHKTTGAISAYSSSLREMGFRSSQVEIALADAGGNFDEALEALTNRNDNMFGDAKHSPGKPTRNITDVIIIEEETEHENANKEIHEDEKEHAGPARKGTTKNVKAGKRSRGRPKKAEVLAEVDDEEDEVPEIANDSTDEDVPIPAAVEPKKKKSRGRPKKGAKVIEEPGQDDAPDAQRDEEQPDDPLKERAALRDRDPNQPSKDTTTHQDHHELEQENEPKATPPDNGIRQDAAPAKETPEKTATPGPSKLHSPIKTARVPLKVGLSRRAKIEPLLRIVRK